jgi:hypothetical protein
MRVLGQIGIGRGPMLRLAGLAAVLACLLAAGRADAADLVEFPSGPKPSAPGHRGCGDTTLFQHRFQIEARGVGCAIARRVLSRPCAIRTERQWSCFSYREDAPFIAWFPTEDLFQRAKYPAVLLRRYPCSRAKVTPSLFGVLGKGFPTRRQLLADDVLRCGLLRPGDSRLAVEETLGLADATEVEAGRHLLVYGLGLERDSVFQIDPELLEIELDRGRVSALSIVQG